MRDWIIWTWDNINLILKLKLQTAMAISGNQFYLWLQSMDNREDILQESTDNMEWQNRKWDNTENIIEW